MTSFTAAAWVGDSPDATTPTEPFPIRLQPMPPEEPPGSPPDDAEGAGAAGAGVGVAAGAGVVVGAVVVGVVDPDPEPVAPPADGTVTGLVGVGAGTGRGRGPGVLLDEPRSGVVTGNETGIEGRVNDPLPESETRSALTKLAAEVADGAATTSDVRSAPEDAPGAYEVGWAVEAFVPLVHTELPPDVGAAGDGPVTAGAGVGGEPTGAVSAGAAISPDQSEAEYVRFGETCL